MKETLEQELVDLATEIIAYQGRLNLSELSQKAHKISEKITILGFVEKYYQMLRTSEQRMTYTLRKVANFIDEQENIFNIDVAFKELQPLKNPLIEESKTEEPAFIAMEPAPVQSAAEPVHFATTPIEHTPVETAVATPEPEPIAAPAPIATPVEEVEPSDDSVVEMTQFAASESVADKPTAIAEPVVDTSDEELASLYQDWNDWHSYVLPDDEPEEVPAPAPEAVAPAQAAPVAQAITQPPVAQPVKTAVHTTINTQQPLREASTPDWAILIEQPAIPPRPQQTIADPEPVQAPAPAAVVEQVLTAESLHPHQEAAPTQTENFIQQQHLTEEQQILRQTPSLEEFLAKSKATVFDKKDHTEEVKPAQSLNDRFSKEIQIGLNDKLAFIQKLFFGSESEYNRVLQHLNQLHSLEEAAQYIQQQVKPTYNNWKGKEEYEERFLHLILRRFE
ncbi:hypothetical protein [Capnocytophaga leadbetteri]